MHVNGQKIEVHEGDNLRRALIRSCHSPHNYKSFISCQGLGSCGTCAVEIIRGDAGEATFMEKWRLRFPPHKIGPNPMRLACQVTVKQDLYIRKHSGFWGAFDDENPP